MIRQLRALLAFWLTIIVMVFISAASVAQTEAISAPNFTAATLEEDIQTAQASETLSDEQKAVIVTTLKSAEDNLKKAAENIANRSRFKIETRNAPVTLRELSENIEKAQDELLRAQTGSAETELDESGESDDAPMREEDLLQLERDLIARESELQAVRSEVEGYDRGFETLRNRQALAPADLNTARTSLGQIAISLSELGNGEIDTLGEAQRKNLEAREYFRATQIDMLEQEIPSLSLRQEIVAARKILAEIRLQIVTQDVQYLQTKTGQKRLNDAGIVKVEAEAIAEDYANFHPIVGDYAAENIEISQEIVELAKSAAERSKNSANIVSRQDDVKSDLRIAEDLIQSGSLDRLAGATLRRLSNQLLPPNVIQSQINQTQKSAIALTQKKLITQDRLRSMPPGRTDIDTVYERARSLNPELAKLTETDRAAYSELYGQRREYLTRISALATTQSSEVSDFQTQQKILLKDTETLRSLLDEKLLWVPSVPAVSFAWPAKIIKGGREIFSGGNFQNVVTVLIQQLRQRILLVLNAIILILGLIRFRTLIWADVIGRAKKVGRVRDDSLWHTPVTVLAGMLMALPFSLMFGLLGLLLALSASTDPFINGLSQGFYALALLCFIFMTWLTWDRDNSLFGAHFDLPTGIRCAVHNNLKWFLPILGILTTLLIVSLEYSSDNIYEGFSLFIFILLSISLGIFGVRIFYRRKDIMDKLFLSNATLHSFRNVIVGAALAFPFITAIFAAIGYYASAEQLLYRGFLTGGILLLVYVIYGMIKRAITVAQRLIMYRHLTIAQYNRCLGRDTFIMDELV